MNGPFGNRFPYTNFHEMNLDWVIQVAKDFLDQYTHIEQLITEGEQTIDGKTTHSIEVLDAKKDEIEGLLNSWYTDHSEDIAGQLADALSDLNDWYTTHSADISNELQTAISTFNENALNIGSEVLASIPLEYDTLGNTVKIYNRLEADGDYTFAQADMTSGTWNYSTPTTNTSRLRNNFMLPVSVGMKVQYSNPTMKIFIGVLATTESVSFAQSTGWVNAGANNILRITANGYLVFMVESTETIAASDYDSTVMIKGDLLNYLKYALPSGITSANDIKYNSTYIINTATAASLANLPSTTAGILITYLFTSNAAYLYQMYYTFTTNTQVFARICSNGSWRAWQYLSNLNNMGLYSDDLNNIDTECIRTIESGEERPAHYPSEFGVHAGVIITVRLNPSSSTYLLQTAINYSTGAILSRNKYDAVWSSWQPPLSMAGYFKNIGNIAGTTDIDNLNSNTIGSVQSSVNPSNYPMGNAPGVIATLPVFDVTGYKEQIAIPYFFSPFTATSRYQEGFHARNSTGSGWNDWTFYKLTPRNHLSKYYAFGDSVTYGYSSDHDHAQSPWNYPSIVGDLIGAQVFNLADPAQGLIKDWTSPATTGNFPIVDTIAQMVSDGDFDDTSLITVGWAYNDGSYYSSLNFGSPTDDIPSSNTGITTFLGYYARILAVLQAAAPAAMVMLVTGYGTPYNSEGHKGDILFSASHTFADGNKTTKQMYDALEEMANYHGFYCINQAKGGVINTVSANYIIGDNIHPTYDNYRVYGNFLASRIASAFQNR